MQQTGFIAAMAADLSFGAYESPAAIERSVREWVIVSVWGPNREFVTLSYTQTPALEDEAPSNLQPKSTHLGILLNRVVGGGEEVSEYLLMRNRPPEIPVGGVFNPTDGFVRILRRGQDASIVAHGRYAHAVGVLDGRHVVRDVPDPAAGATQAQGWHMTAGRRSWIGEFFVAERPHPVPHPAPHPASDAAPRMRPAPFPRVEREAPVLLGGPRRRTRVKPVAPDPVVEPVADR